MLLSWQFQRCTLSYMELKTLNWYRQKKLTIGILHYFSSFINSTIRKCCCTSVIPIVFEQEIILHLERFWRFVRVDNCRILTVFGTRIFVYFANFATLKIFLRKSYVEEFKTKYLPLSQIPGVSRFRYTVAHCLARLTLVNV